MTVAIVTGAGGLVGAEAARFLAAKGLDVVGIDNDTRAHLFGAGASTRNAYQALARDLPSYTHVDGDIRDPALIDGLFARHGRHISLVVHAAAQPSHDWAANEPLTDFTINAVATMNLLEATRRHCARAAFVFCSTNKVYGDTPNRLPVIEQETRWELPPGHPAFGGIDETMIIDASMHSLFGVSKTAGDLMVQEYGRYFGINTACFRCGCITGSGHAGAKLHGFLSYLMKCAVTDAPYTVIGYGGKQVRDNIHSWDLVNAFWHFFQAPAPARVYNIGGGRKAHCSVIEAVAIAEGLTGRAMQRTQVAETRMGDHIWWISDFSRFQNDYPAWALSRDVESIMAELHEDLAHRTGR